MEEGGRGELTTAAQVEKGEAREGREGYEGVVCDGRTETEIEVDELSEVTKEMEATTF